MNTEIGRAIFGALTQDQQSTVLAAGHVRHYADLQLIASRGATDAHLSIIEAGAVRLSKVGRDGRQSVTTTLMPGDSFGEFTVFARVPRQFDFHAVGATKIREIPPQEFQRLLSESPALRNKLIETLARKLLFATEALEDMRQLPLTPRAAKLLLAWTSGQTSPASWTGSQNELAETLGVSRVAVSHALRELRVLGLIGTAYRRIDISDVTQLQDWLERFNTL